jgi:hypothetical protein
MPESGNPLKKKARRSGAPLIHFAERLALATLIPLVVSRFLLALAVPFVLAGLIWTLSGAGPIPFIGRTILVAAGTGFVTLGSDRALTVSILIFVLFVFALPGAIFATGRTIGFVLCGRLLIL